MPIPRVITKANRAVLNKVTGRFAGVIPPFVLLRHTGRTSGTSYLTPLMAFPTPDGFVIALTYGPGTDWQRNVEAGGTATARYRRRDYALSAPRLVEGSAREQPLPRIVQLALKLLGVRFFLYVHAEPKES